MDGDTVVWGNWEDAQALLDDEASFVATDGNGVIKEADYRLVDDDPHTEGVFFDPGLFDDTPAIDREDRASGGFYFSNVNGYSVELKYRFPDELRDYPEQIHVHNVPELYVAQGRFTMRLGTADGYTDVAIDDEMFIVPAGMYHGITDCAPDASLLVARGDPDADYVGKWGPDGTQLYDHFDADLVFPDETVYREEDDAMYRL